MNAMFDKVPGEEGEIYCNSDQALAKPTGRTNQPYRQACQHPYNGGKITLVKMHSLEADLSICFNEGIHIDILKTNQTQSNNEIGFIVEVNFFFTRFWPKNPLFRLNKYVLLFWHRFSEVLQYLTYILCFR